MLSRTLKETRGSTRSTSSATGRVSTIATDWGKLAVTSPMIAAASPSRSSRASATDRRMCRACPSSFAPVSVTTTPRRHAVQQRRPEFALEIADLRAQGRLGDAQPFCGAGYRALLGNGDEVTEDTEVHRPIVSTRWRRSLIRLCPIGAHCATRERRRRKRYAHHEARPVGRGTGHAGHSVCRSPGVASRSNPARDRRLSGRRPHRPRGATRCGRAARGDRRSGHRRKPWRCAGQHRGGRRGASRTGWHDPSGLAPSRRRSSIRC